MSYIRGISIQKVPRSKSSHSSKSSLSHSLRRSLACCNSEENVELRITRSTRYNPCQSLTHKSRKMVSNITRLHPVRNKTPVMTFFRFSTSRANTLSLDRGAGRLPPAGEQHSVATSALINRQWYAIIRRQAM